MAPDFVSYSGLIIDDIVLPDGRTFFNMLGGGGTHALAGMRVWSGRLGYFAAVGSDFGSSHRELLEGLGIDLRGLIERNGFPTARAWQLFEPDERRIEVFRTRIEDFYRLEARFEEMPRDYLAARGYHLSHGTLDDMVNLVTRLRAVNPTARIGWEPTPLQHSGSEEAFRAVLTQVDVFSPDESEAREITGKQTRREMFDTLLEWGAPVAALRMGARGSQVVTAEGASYAVPAVPTTVVDTTGAGNAYVGGFLVGFTNGDDVAEASAKAAVSASFAVEQFGVPQFDERTPAIAESRLEWARERTVEGSAVL